jgi:TPR repeat protein
MPLANEGNPEAQYNMGWLYANGIGARVDVPTALYWWEKAAASNHAPSQFSLGMVYLTGDGKTIRKNVPEAIHWHMRSARNGYEEAQEMMRQLYKTRKRAVQKLYPDIAGEPYCESLREKLIAAARASGSQVITEGVYGATQGPRLETAAEIRRMRQDGCDLVGMTAMPEASLAREAGLCYATCALVVNWAAGIGDEGPISQQLIDKYLEQGMESVRRLIFHLDR